MDWREEYEPSIDEEKATKKYIKGELNNYYLYLSKWYEAGEKQISAYSTKSGSFITVPDGTPQRDSRQHRAQMVAGEIQMARDPYEQKMSTIDSWMNILTEAQHKVVKLYVMQYQCEDAHRAAIELGYSEETIKKHTKRAIDRIYTRINKIL